MPTATPLPPAPTRPSALDAQARPGHPVGRRTAAHRRDPPPLRGRRRRRHPLLANDRLTGLRGESERETYARAKTTLAVVVAPPSALKPQPIPPSADWRIDLAKGCPAHCQYCYLAGSLSGPPITRVYANLDDVLDGSSRRPRHRHRGTVERGDEGTTFELSCYTDPLGIEHLTGSLARRSPGWGRGLRDGVSLRFTTKFDDVAELLGRGPPAPHPGPLLGQRGGGGPPLRGRHLPRRPGWPRCARWPRPATASG